MITKAPLTQETLEQLWDKVVYKAPEKKILITVSGEILVPLTESLCMRIWHDSVESFMGPLYSSIFKKYGKVIRANNINVTTYVIKGIIGYTLYGITDYAGASCEPYTQHKVSIDPSSAGRSLMVDKLNIDTLQHEMVRLLSTHIETVFGNEALFVEKDYIFSTQKYSAAGIAISEIERQPGEETTLFLRDGQNPKTFFMCKEIDQREHSMVWRLLDKILNLP